MSDGEFLSGPEIHHLTGAARSTAQSAWLKERALPHRVDGKRIILSRAHVRAWLEGRSVVASNGDSHHDWRRLILKPDADLIPSAEDHPHAKGGIYALWTKPDSLLYIGQSLDIRMRITQHIWASRRGEIPPFYGFSAIDVPNELMRPLEIAHIHALHPLANALFERPSHADHDLMVAEITSIWGKHTSTEAKA